MTVTAYNLFFLRTLEIYLQISVYICSRLPVFNQDGHRSFGALNTTCSSCWRMDTLGKLQICIQRKIKRK
jgi:hypothetical protein